MLYIPKDNRQITQIINNHRDKVSVTKQSDNQISITNKKKACFVNATVKSGINKGYITYVPISVYTPLTRKINAYIRTGTPLLSGATTSKYKITYMKLKKYRSIKIIGTLGNYFYIDTKNENIGYNGRGFVKKSDVVHIECSPKFRTARVNTTRQIDVVVHNNGVSGLKWKTDKNRVFKKGKYTKKGKKKLPYTTKRTYNLKSKTEYAGYKTVSKRSATDRLFISSYSPTERIEGFITIKQNNKYDYVKLWKAATDDFGYYKQLPRYTKVTILGTCKDYYYIQQGNSKGYVKKVNVAYIAWGSFTRNMYRYHNKTISATLVHSDDDYNIKWSVIKNTSALDKIKIYNAGGYKKLSFFADKPKTVTFTAKYYYSGGRYISRKVSVKIKPITLSVSSSKLKVGQNKKLTVKIKETGETLSYKKLKYKFSKKGYAKLQNKTTTNKKTKKKTTAKHIIGTKAGSTKLTVSYYDVKKKVSVKVSPLMIYQTARRPGLKSEKDIADDKKDNTSEYRDGKKYSKYYDNKNEAKDMHSGDLPYKNLTKEKGLKKNAFKSEKGHYDDLMRLCSEGSFMKYQYYVNGKIYKIDLKSIPIGMFSRFYNGIGGTYSNKNLSKATKTHPSFKWYISDTKREINNAINIYHGNVYSMKYTHTEKKKDRLNYTLLKLMDTNKITNPSFDYAEDRYNGLVVAVHGIWGVKIEVTEYKFNTKTHTYKGKLKYTFFDNFGLDNKDIERWLPDMGAFRSWFILQRYDKYRTKNGKKKHKPFITYMYVNSDFSGNVLKY